MTRRTKSTVLPGIFSLVTGLLSISFLTGIFYILAFYKFPIPCANSVSCMESTKLKVENGQIGTFFGQKIKAPSINLAQKVDTKKVLGDETATGEKHVYVDLTTQTLTAYQGETLFMKVPVSTGKWSPTPTGDFAIWIKLRATRMTGGQGADFYDLPNVPYVMFFAGDGISQAAGFSLHGAYWHNNFGHPMSHGCVNMRPVDAMKLYFWANPVTNGTITHADNNNPGTKVTIYGQTPL